MRRRDAAITEYRKMKQDPIVGYYTEDELRKAAWIIGPSGAAAKALLDAEKRGIMAHCPKR